MSASLPSLRADEIQAEYAMFHDPEFSEPVVIKELHSELIDLWKQALVRPEADYQSQTAEAIAEAAEAGYLGLEWAREDLHRILTADETHPAARFAAARALIALDARTSSAALFEASQWHGSQLRLLVEPALADWEFEPIRDIWRERVRDPQTNRRELMLALRGLARAQDGSVLPEMRAIVQSADRPVDVRLVAARAAGAVAASGLESDVARLMSLDSSTPAHRLCAVALLSRHTSEECREWLVRLSRDDDPAVAEQSLGLLLAIDPALVVPLAEEAMQNADPKVRRRGIEAYAELPAPDRIVVLGRMLDDVHPDVRGRAREAFFQVAARPEFGELVRDCAMDLLSGESWRGQEQAALLLGALDHEPAAGRLLELLESERPEVMIASAWALRVQAIPEMLPRMFAHAQRQSTIRQSLPTAGLDEQVAHLFEAFGLMGYSPADGLLRGYIPRTMANGEYSRGAALWALGFLHAGMPDEELAAQLVERMNDTASINPPELQIVFRMSAVSLGRMQAVSQLSALRQRLERTYPYDPVAYSIRWSIHEITGEEFPELGPVVVPRAGWFLEPIPREEAGSP